MNIQSIKGWFLPANSINDIQQLSVSDQISTCKKAHYTNLSIRINGQDEIHQADWVKHLIPITGEHMEYSDVEASDVEISDVNGPEPCYMKVPIYNLSEVDLMGALETVISHFSDSTTGTLSPRAVARAVKWLNSKYGMHSN